MTRQPPALELLSYEEMKALPEPEWLVDGVISKRSTAIMFSKSDSFKSFLAADIGLSIESGRSWHGHAVTRGGTLFVATEGAVGFGRLRIPAWYDFYSVPETDRHAYLYPKEIRLDVVDDVTALITALRNYGPFSLVVLDIFGGTLAGSEIEDKTARAWVHGTQRILREAGVSILTVAHSGYQDDTRARMHSHLWGSFDTRLRIERERGTMACTMTVERHKDADSNGRWGFRMEPAGESLVPILDASVKPSATRSLSAKQRIALQALDDALQIHGQRKQGNDWPPCDVVLLDQWRVHCDRNSLSDSDKADSRKKAFQRARTELQSKGIIRIFDGHVWRCFDG